MKYAEMKTAFMSVMDALKVEASVFDFAEAIDSAQLFMLGNLPTNSIPNMIAVYSIDKSPSSQRQAPLPADCFKIESVRLAKERVINESVETYPKYIPATIVPQRDFLTKSMFSTEPVISLFNGMLNFNPDVAGPVTGYPGAIELTYRRMPNLYIANYNYFSNGRNVGTLNQDSGNSRIISSQGQGKTWEELGLNINNLPGGKMAFLYGTYVVFANIDFAYDDESGDFSYLHLSESSNVAYVPDRLLQNVLIAERPNIYSGSESLFSNDNNLPDFPVAYHQLILDYAIGKFLLPRKPDQASQYFGIVIQTFQSLGVTMNIEFGGKK